MKNNKGQTLVLFIIFIPILLLLAAFVIDTGIIIRESTRLKSTTKTVLTDTFYQEDLSDEKIINLLQENNINVDNVEINVLENAIQVKNSYDIESVFGKIIGLKKYNVKIDITAKEENGSLKFIKE